MIGGEQMFRDSSYKLLTVSSSSFPSHPFSFSAMISCFSNLKDVAFFKNCKLFSKFNLWYRDIPTRTFWECRWLDGSSLPHATLPFPYRKDRLGLQQTAHRFVSRKLLSIFLSKKTYVRESVIKWRKKFWVLKIKSVLLVSALMVFTIFNCLFCGEN